MKNISLYQKCKSDYTRCHPVPLRGASAIVTNEGRVAVDAGSADNERHESVRQRRVVPTPRGWRRRWQQCMAHRGERVISRKAIAQGMSDVLRCPVCSCAHFLCTLRMRSRVQRASGIPCALIREGERVTRELLANPGRNASRECESVHATKERKNGLLRFARNDGVG
jgi:hypothetical protein